MEWTYYCIVLYYNNAIGSQPAPRSIKISIRSRIRDCCCSNKLIEGLFNKPIGTWHSKYNCSSRCKTELLSFCNYISSSNIYFDIVHNLLKFNPEKKIKTKIKFRFIFFFDEIIKGQLYYISCINNILCNKKRKVKNILYLY